MIPRRTFLGRALGLAGAALVTRAVPSAWARPLGSNDDIRIGMIGLGLKGAQMTKHLRQMPGVRLVALCEVDPRRLAEQVELLKKEAIDVFATTDLRELLDRADVDAVIISTGNHWHALAAVWACQAGKDVYVEKPVGRTVWEGRKVIEAAGRYDRIVQTGTQLRSDYLVNEVIDYIRSGELGRIEWLMGVSYHDRGSVGLELPWYPEWLDYNLYCGPSPMRPLERTNLHYDWHFDWDTGNGDLVNMGVHMVDVARRFLGDHAIPRRVLSLGGRYGFADAGSAPNTQFTILEFPEAPLYYDNRGLPARPGVRFPDQFRGLRNGLVVQCEKGYYAGYYGGGIYDNDGRKIKHKDSHGNTVGRHLENFLAAVRTRRVADLAASIQVGHDSSRFCHYGNISYRAGTTALYDDVLAAVGPHSQAVEQLQGMREHLGVHGVDLQRDPLVLGPWLELSQQDDDDIDGATGGGEGALERARLLLKEVQRPPFVIPEQV